MYSKTTVEDDFLKRYTEIKEEYFNEIYQEHGNDGERLKIVDSIKFQHPKYYVLKDFLLKED